MVYNPLPMNVEINGINHTLEADISLQQLVSDMDLGNKRLAIEVNREIVPRSQYPRHIINDGDKIEIVQAIGGGQNRT